LKGKFDDIYKKISMAWLWARIHTRGNSTNEKGEEVLGYLDGGFESLTKKLAEKINSIIDSNLLNEIFQYFKNRYIENGDANDIFNRFDFGREPASTTYKNFVKDRLLKEETTNQEKLQSLLYIAFRLRNNLFHGSKEVEKLYEQNENFKQINSLLMVIIEQKAYCRY
jgi:hypothetical protein